MSVSAANSRKPGSSTSPRCRGRGTRGLVIVLGEVSHNVGAGMTGGTLYLLDDYRDRLNPESVETSPIRPTDEQLLLETLNHYSQATNSQRVQWLLGEWRVFRHHFLRVVPIRTAKEEREGAAREESRKEQSADPLSITSALRGEARAM